MKNISIPVLLVLGLFVCGNAAAQQKKPASKARIGKTVSDTSSAAQRERMKLRLTDTTNIGFGDTTRLRFTPAHPRLPVQNNPNPYRSNPLSLPASPVDTVSTKAPAKAPAAKNKN